MRTEQSGITKMIASTSLHVLAVEHIRDPIPNSDAPGIPSPVVRSSVGVVNRRDG